MLFFLEKANEIWSVLSVYLILLFSPVVGTPFTLTDERVFLVEDKVMFCENTVGNVCVSEQMVTAKYVQGEQNERC